MRNTPSIADIAKELNISKTTVSFILNGKAREKKIRPALEEMVKEYAEAVGYIGNDSARILRTGKSNLIGVLVEDISDPFFSSIARAIEKRASSLGYRIVCASTENDLQRTINIISSYKEAFFDGFIIAPPPGLEKELEVLHASNIPCVLFDRYLPDLVTDNVIVDNAFSVYKAVKHLHEGGHRRIGFVTINSEQMQMTERLKGYMKGADEFQGEWYIKKIQPQCGHIGTLIAIKDFILSNPHLDGIVFSTNYLTYAGIEVIKDAKIDVPGELGLVGFDDSPLFKHTTPPITVISQPIKPIADKIIEAIFKKINTSNVESVPETAVIATDMIFRSSSRNRFAIYALS